VRESFYDFGKEWHVAVGDKFRGGEKPNLADLVCTLFTFRVVEKE
jgi:hypothetical protein